jgi:hypothetical protein
VIYHNKFATTRGWIRTSATYAVKTGSGDERRLTQRTLGEGLGLNADEGVFYVFRDHTGGLEYIRSGRELVEQGLYVELEAYKCNVFIDWREIRDDPFRTYAQLTGYLGGSGVPSIDEAVKEIFLQPLHYPFKELVNADMFRRLIEAVAADDRQPSADTSDELVELGELEDQPDEELADDARLAGDSDEPGTSTDALLDEVEQKMLTLLAEVKQFTESSGDEQAIAREVRGELAAILDLPAFEKRFAEADSVAAIEQMRAGLSDDAVTWGTLFGWAFVHALGKITDTPDYAEQARSWIDEWLLGRIVANTLRELGADEQAASRAVAVIRQATSHQDWYQSPDMEHAQQLLEALLGDREMQQLLGVNRYQGVLWFDKAAFERLLWWMQTVAAVAIGAEPDTTPEKAATALSAAHATVKQLQDAADKSGYQVEKLLEIVQA